MRILLRKFHGYFGAMIAGSSGRPIGPATGGSAAPALAVQGFGLWSLLVVTILAALLFFAATLGHVSHGHALAFGIAGTTTEEIKSTIASIKTAFEDFKRSNDERLKEIADKGHASADVVQNVEKANTAITNLTTELSELKAQLREVENANARLALASGSITDEAREQARQFKATVTNTPLRKITASSITEADVKAMRDYGDALEHYMRNEYKGMSAEMRNALQTGSDPNGGFAVKPDTSGRMVKFLVDESPIVEYCSQQTIGTDALEGDLDMDEDVTSGWVGETETRSETSTPRGPGEWRIPIYEQYAMPKATQKMLDDADRDIEGWLEKKVGRRFGRVIQSAIHSGTGVKQLKGFLTYASVGNKPAATNLASWQRIETLKTGVNGAFAASSPGDKLIDLINALRPEYRAAANFFMPRLVVAEVRKLKDGQGNYLWQPSFNERTGAQLLGYGIVEDEGLPALTGNDISTVFGDMKSAYQLVYHKTGIRLLRDNLTQKGWILFYTTQRVGGDVVDFQALKFLKFST
jgi:HK97 family phage major capsid protein